jgi:hypothetical protein
VTASYTGIESEEAQALDSGAAAGEPGGAGDEGTLSQLFAGQTVPADDEDAAATLASAFSNEPAPSDASLGGAPARAASDELSLDHVFRKGRASADANPSAANVSFDEFFARRDAGSDDGEGSGMASNGTATSTDHGTSAGRPGASDQEQSEQDLELFHAWLEGLKK